MPFKSASSKRSCEFRKVTKYCLWCHEELKLNNNRDIVRKNFCSHSHRQKYRFKHGEWSMNRLWEKNNTPEANAKKSLPREKNPNWLGDRKMLKRPRTSYEGNKWRKAVFERDNYTCQECGKHGGKLNAHHIVGYYENEEERWNVDNGITLCVPCHKKTDTYGWKSINVRRKENNCAI